MDSSQGFSFRPAFQISVRWSQPCSSALRNLVERVLQQDRSFRRSRLAPSQEFNQLVVGELAFPKSQESQSQQPDFTADLSDITLVQNNLSPRPACDSLLERRSKWDKLRLQAKQFSDILGGRRFRVQQFRVRCKASN